MVQLLKSFVLSVCFPLAHSLGVTNDFKNGLGSNLETYSYNGFITLQLLIDAVALAIDPKAIENHMYVLEYVCMDGCMDGWMDGWMDVSSVCVWVDNGNSYCSVTPCPNPN